MTKTSYTAEARAEVQALIDTEPTLALEAETMMEQWRKDRFDPSHIHSTFGTRYACLLRRLPLSRTYLAALHDRHRQEVTATALRTGSPQSLAATAMVLAPTARGAWVRNLNWKG